MDSSDSDEMYDFDGTIDSEKLSDSEEVADSDETVDSYETSDSNDDYLRKMIYPFTQTQFFKSCLKQDFILPDSLIYYIAKNPPNPKMYEKLIQTCKHFFITNKILVVSSFIYHYADYHEADEDITWHTSFNRKSLNLDEISSKLWFSQKLRISTKFYGDIQQKVALPFSKIYRCDAKKCELMDLDISFKDFMFLTPKCEDMNLYTVAVINDDGSVVPVEKLVEALPHLTSFFYDFSDLSMANVAKIVTSSTVQNLLQIPHFPTLDNFTLHAVPQAFDIQRCFAYIKENKTTFVELASDDAISQEYKTSIEAIVQEIIETADRDYEIPWFYCRQMDDNMYYGLLAICTRRGYYT